MALCLTVLYRAPMLLLLRFQINLDPGKGEFNFEQQALKLEYVPPASCGEVERATITIMDKGEKQKTPTVQRKVVTNNIDVITDPIINICATRASWGYRSCCLIRHHARCLLYMLSSELTALNLNFLGSMYIPSSGDAE